jgi:hypothetical protein
MRLVLILIGILTVFGGLLPFLKSAGWLPAFLEFIPTSGTGYQAIITAIGIFAIFVGMKYKKRYYH